MCQPALPPTCRAVGTGCPCLCCCKVPDFQFWRLEPSAYLQQNNNPCLGFPVLPFYYLCGRSSQRLGPHCAAQGQEDAQLLVPGRSEVQVASSPSQGCLGCGALAAWLQSSTFGPRFPHPNIWLLMAAAAPGSPHPSLRKRLKLLGLKLPAGRVCKSGRTWDRGRKDLAKANLSSKAGERGQDAFQRQEGSAASRRAGVGAPIQSRAFLMLQPCLPSLESL